MYIAKKREITDCENTIKIAMTEKYIYMTWKNNNETVKHIRILKNESMTILFEFIDKWYNKQLFSELVNEIITTKLQIKEI